MTLRRKLLSYLLLACSVWAGPVVADPAPDTTGYPPDIAAILSKGTLVIAMVKRDLPPYFMTNAKGELTGGEVEFARMIAKQLGVKAVFDRTSDTYDGVVTEVQQHKADIGMGLLSVTPHRALRVSFTEPYFKFHPSLLVNRYLMAQNGWQANVLKQLATAGPSVKIGALTGTSGIDEIKDDFPGTTLVEYGSWDDVLRDVASGTLFAAVTSSPSVQSAYESLPSLRLRAVEVVNTRHTEAIGIAVPWDSLNFRYWLTLYIRELQNDGTFDYWIGNPVKTP